MINNETIPFQEMIPMKKNQLLVKTDQSDPLEMERIVFFSDAVFAIAITLLALEIRLPESESLLDDRELFEQLTGVWHSYLGFFISFMVIGVFWMAHHRKFRLIKRFDSRLMMLNLLMLMVIAFIPFPSSLISKYPGQTATIFYALTMILGELLLGLIWWYASWNNRLTDLDVNQRRRQFINPIATSLVFALSIGVALASPDLAKFSWFLILPVTLYANR
jgi:uncharacterized membrane protein